MSKLLTFIAVSLSLIALSLMTTSRLGVFMFSSGSDSTLNVVRTPLWLTIVLLLIFLGWMAYCLWYSGFNLFNTAVLLLLLSLWWGSGRAIGLYPDGRIVVGWFFYNSQIVDLRPHDEDYEVHASHTKISLDGWCIKIISHDTERSIFVGPFIKNSVINLFKEFGYPVGNVSPRLEKDTK